MGLIQSGVLICEIVKRIQITPVIGVFRNPKTDKLKLENIRKAFEALRKIPQMSQMYMQDEKKIL